MTGYLIPHSIRARKGFAYLSISTHMPRYPLPSSLNHRGRGHSSPGDVVDESPTPLAAFANVASNHAKVVYQLN